MVILNMLKFLILGFIMLGLKAQDPATPCKGGDECCDGITCGLGEGDCDSHEDCVGHLRCGVDNCDGPGFDPTDDCCWEDLAFPLPCCEIDSENEKCEIAEDLEKKIAQAAVAQGCDLPKGRPESLSLNECAQMSCSVDMIGKSFTCNNQDKERTCKELLSLLDAMVTKRNAQCSQVLRDSDPTCSGKCRYGDDCQCIVTTGSSNDYCYESSTSTHHGWCGVNSKGACTSLCNTENPTTLTDDTERTIMQNGIPACVLNTTNDYKWTAGNYIPVFNQDKKVFACKSSSNVFITYNSGSLPAGEDIYDAALLLKSAFSDTTCFVTYCDGATATATDDSGDTAVCGSCITGTIPPTAGSPCAAHVKSCADIVTNGGDIDCANSCGLQSYMLNAGFAGFDGTTNPTWGNF